MGSIRTKVLGIDEEEWDAARHPSLTCVSPGMLIRVVPVLRKPLPVELCYVPISQSDPATESALMSWNLTWQSGGAVGNWRCRFGSGDEAPPAIHKILGRVPDGADIRLIPHYVGDEDASTISAYRGLYQLLPKRTLQRFGLKSLPNMVWPTSPPYQAAEQDPNIKPRLQKAFAAHVWPMLCRQSNIESFGADDPIRILAHGLDFWMPSVDAVIASRMREFGRAKTFRNRDDEELAAKILADLGPDYDVEPPLYHSEAWAGEEEALEATREVVEEADRKGKLRAIIDAIQSHRIEDDFSSRWSYAKEDFERKLFHKRMKSRVTFVELKDTVPVHGRESELDEALLWQDLLAVVDEKERHVIVLLRSGETRLGDIAQQLGYANHSPVSKQLARIQAKAKRLLGL